MDKHDIIVALKDFALELGRTPRRTEFFQRIKNGQHNVEITFGSYTTLCIAAGLETNSSHKNRQGKLTNDIFKRDVEEVIEDYKPRKNYPKIQYAPTLAIPDTHFPFINKKLMDEIYKFSADNKPKRIIQVGDLYDMYSHTKFPKSLNVYTPQREEELGRRGAEEMWKILKRDNPEAECVQLAGNHDQRALKRTLESLPSLEHIVIEYLYKLMSFEGVKLISDPREEYKFDDVLAIHGYKSGIGSHRDYNLSNIICGHQHIGGVTFRRIQGKTLWELNAGLAGDPESKALGYTPQKIFSATPGFGWLDGYGPRFIPF